MDNFDFSQLVAAAIRIQNVWNREGISYCFIGGLAVQYWGEVRMTQDVDATVATGFGNEVAMIKKLFRNLSPRISDAETFARLHRIVLAQEPGGIPIDVSLAGFPYELEVIARAKDQELISGKRVRICEPSDLVILKAFANRSRDWDDIRSILIRNGRLLDWELIEKELRMLCDLKEEPEIVGQLLTMRDKVAQKHK